MRKTSQPCSLQLHQESAHFLCKGPNCFILGFVGHSVSVTTIQHNHWSAKVAQPQTICKPEWRQLCANKTLFTKIGSGAGFGQLAVDGQPLLYTMFKLPPKKQILAREYLLVVIFVHVWAFRAELSIEKLLSAYDLGPLVAQHGKDEILENIFHGTILCSLRCYTR